MSAPYDRRAGKITELSAEECRELLETTTVGRVAFVDGDGQQLIPANFVVINDEVYFRTVRDGVLDSLSRGHNDVAFGVDHHEDLYRNGWNVTVRGSATGVEDRATITKVLGHPKLRPWAGGIRPSVIKISPRSIAGRRVSGN